MRQRLAHLAGRRPWAWFAAYFVLTAALYQLALRAPWTAPWTIPALGVDGAIPLVPATTWLYLTYFFLMPAWVVATRHQPPDRRGALLMAAGAVVVGNLTLNLAFPTRVGRVLDPTDVPWPLSQVIASDTPLAALPSGHVSLPVALAVLAALGRLSERSRAVFTVWAIALGVSVLTTRQHVLLDAVAGALYGLAAAVVAARVFLRRAAV